jgi:EmrB/QacA subfamily drug resistance transporter
VTVPEADHRRQWWTLGVLCLSLMVIGIDGSILNIALPTLSRDLHAGTSDLQWMVDAYVLVFAGLLLTGGSLGDRFGRKGALTFGLLVFGASSAAAAFASGVTQVIAARACMGVGAAFIMPATLSILTNVFTDPRERGRAIGVWASVSALGSALGPAVGGLLLAHFWWGSVFLVNVPVVVIAVVLGHFVVPTSRDPHPQRIDVAGALLSIVGLSVLLWTIIGAPERGWGSSGTIAGFAVAVVTLAAFVLWELHSSHPMLDMTFFRDPRFTVASIAITMSFFAVMGSLFLVSQMFQFVLGYSALEAGVRLMPFALAFVAAAPIAPRLVERLGTKWMVAGGFGLAAAGLYLLSGVDAHSSYPRAIVGLVVMAIGMGFAMPSATESIMGSLPREKAGVGSAMNDTTRQTGGALGIAVLGSILVSQYRSSLAGAAGHLGLSHATLARAQDSASSVLELAGRLGGRTGSTLVAAARGAWIDGMSLATAVAAAMVLGGALLALAYLPARDGTHHLNMSEILPVDIVIDDDQLDAAPDDPDATVPGTAVGGAVRDSSP